MHPYTLIRSRRKTMAIYITKEATVEVRAPLHVPKGTIDDFVAKKAPWISKHLSQMNQRVSAQNAFVLTYGHTILYRGIQCAILPHPGNNFRFDLEKNQLFLPPNLSAEAMQLAIVSIYRKLAQEIISQKAAHFSLVMNLHPKAIKINAAKTRWGSCSGQGNLNFSWMLLMAPDRTIDYVVIHELAHLAEMNHSPKFWNLVHKFCPDYEVHRQNLRNLQQILWQQTWS